VDLASRYLPLARSLARRYAGRGEPLDDLVQVGAVGLVAAARRYDPDRGVPFAAYAAPTVEGELRRHLRDRTSTVRVPRREQERAAVVRRSAHLVAQRIGREASPAEAASAAGVSVDEARAALDGAGTTVPLSVLDGRPCARAADDFMACEDREFLRAVLGALEPREREVVSLRFANDLSQAEIGRRLQISQSQASRLLAAALEKLRRSLGAAEHRAA